MRRSRSLSARSRVRLSQRRLLSGGSRATGEYSVERLVSDGGVPAARHDRDLVNAWGLAAEPGGAWWAANEANDSSTLYSAQGRKQLLTVTVPGGPTGIAYYGGGGFRGEGRRRFGAGAFRVRLRGRQPARVEPGRASRLVDALGGRRRPRRPGHGVPRARDRRRPPLCNRLPQRARRRLRRALAARGCSRCIPRLADPCVVCAVRHRRDRRSRVRDATSRGRRSTGTTHRRAATSTSSIWPGSSFSGSLRSVR